MARWFAGHNYTPNADYSLQTIFPAGGDITDLVTDDNALVINTADGFQRIHTYDSTSSATVDIPHVVAPQELGAEELTNGDFSSEGSLDSSSAPLDNWANQGTHDATNKFTIAAGTGLCTAISSGVTSAIRQGGLSISAVYRYSITVTDVSGGSIAIQDGASDLMVINTVGTHVTYYTATSANPRVTASVAGTNVTFTAVSIQEVTVPATGRWIEKDMFQEHTFFHDTFTEEFDALVTSDGATVTMSLEKIGGGDLTAIFQSGKSTVDCTPAKTVTLTPGTDAAPTTNYVHILPASPDTLTVSTSAWPATEHIKVAFLLVPSAAYVQTSGPYINQNWNDGTAPDSPGHLAHITEAIRLTMDGAHWHSGIAGNGATSDYITIDAGDTPDSVYFLSTAGVVYQMHKHAFPALDTSGSDDIHVVNSSVAAYNSIQDLADETEDSLGATLVGRYYNIVIWGVANKTGEYTPLMMNMPSGSYNNLTNAVRDVDGFDVYDIPREFKEESTTGFLIARITLRHSNAAGGTLTVENTTDLRGRTPGTASGSTVGGATTFADNQFAVFNVSDITKQVDLDLSGITTGNTRTITPADADMTMLSTTDHTDLTDGGITVLHSHNRQENIFLNGDFDIAQRGTSFPAIGTGTYALDRFEYFQNGTMVTTLSQDTDVPTQAESGHLSTHSLKIDCTTADASMTTNDRVSFWNQIEGYDFRDIQGNTGTLSFWVKATKTGIYSIQFRNAGSDRSYVTEYVVNTTLTWEKKTVVVVFDEPAGTWDYTNGRGLSVMWNLCTGPDIDTSSLDSWESANNLTSTNQVNGMDNTANNFWIAQAKFEKGSIVTPYVSRPFGTELSLCQRYFEKSWDVLTAPGTATQVGSHQVRVNGVSTSQPTFATPFFVSKRAVPTMLWWNPNSGSSTSIRNYSAGADHSYTTTVNPSERYTGYPTLSAGGLDGELFRLHFTSDSEI